MQQARHIPRRPRRIFHHLLVLRQLSVEVFERTITTGFNKQNRRLQIFDHTGPTPTTPRSPTRAWGGLGYWERLEFLFPEYFTFFCGGMMGVAFFSVAI